MAVRHLKLEGPHSEILVCTLSAEQNLKPYSNGSGFTCGRRTTFKHRRYQTSLSGSVRYKPVSLWAKPSFALWAYLQDLGNGQEDGCLI